MSFKQQVIIALIGNAKDWMPIYDNLEDWCKSAGVEPPTNTDEAIVISRKYFAKMLNEYADEICKATNTENTTTVKDVMDQLNEMSDEFFKDCK